MTEEKKLIKPKKVSPIKKPSVPKSTPILRRLEENVGESRQSLIYTTIYKLKRGKDEWKLRVQIKSDSYDFQCYAIVDVFHPVELKWNRLGSVHHSKMKTKKELSYGTSRSPILFSNDCDTLLNLAKTILL